MCRRVLERERSAGACRGFFRPWRGFGRRLSRWRTAALAAGFSAGPAGRFTVESLEAGPAASLGALPHNRDASRVKAFVDWQNNVTVKDIRLATREGFRSIEHIKRFTTNGMATDQGRLRI